MQGLECKDAMLVPGSGLAAGTGTLGRGAVSGECPSRPLVAGGAPREVQGGGTPFVWGGCQGDLRPRRSELPRGWSWSPGGKTLPWWVTDLLSLVTEGLGPGHPWDRCW